MVSSLIVLYTINKTIFIVATILFTGIIVSRLLYFSKRYLPAIQKAQEYDREYSGILNDAVLNFTSLKLYNAVGKFSKELKSKKQEANYYRNRASKKEFTFGAMANIIYIVILVILMIYSINLFENNMMTLGSFIFFINAMISLKSQTTSFTWSYIHIGEIIVKLKNSYELLYSENNVKDIDKPDIIVNTGKIEFKNVSFYENIKIAKPDATDEEIYNAAKKAELHDFIENLEDKYNTIVGERGIKLSGGQRQRIALARIFLRDAKIVIFDEATSSLDNNTEFKIQRNINKYFNRQTIICIAHRLSTLKDMDNILVIENGEVIDFGTPDVIIPKYDKKEFALEE